MGNRREGVRRIVISGRLITLASVTLIIIEIFFPMTSYLFVGVPLYQGVVLGVLVWLGGWVLQGFFTAS